MNYGGALITVLLYGGYAESHEQDVSIITEDDFNIWTEDSQDILTED